MDKKLLFFDIDGTLITNLGRPSERVKKAIRNARAGGHGVFLCTGRNMPIIGQEILEVGFDGVVSSAGAHVEVGSEILRDQMLPDAIIQECLQVFHREGVFCRVETEEGIYTDGEMEALIRDTKMEGANSELARMQRELEKGLPLQPFARYPGNGAYKICFTGTALEAIERAKRRLSDRFRFVVHAYKGGTSCYNGEIIPRNVDKGQAMSQVCEYLGRSLTDTVAFGDSMNDLEMIQCAGVGIAMGNACPELKEAADLVCESVEEDGVFYQMRRMGLG